MTSIILLTQNRFVLMRQAIESLRVSDVRHAHTGLMSGWTLTVVDDGSDDPRCIEYLKALPRPHCAVRSIADSSHNLGDLKSAGVVESQARFGRGDWLCICDNDVFFKQGWLERMTEMAEASEPYGFRLWGAQNHPYHRPWGVKEPAIGMQECETLAGTHFFMRWKTWEAYGPLHSDGPGPLMNEDVSFCNRVKAAGGRIGVPVEPCVIDTGITNSLGVPSPGAGLKAFKRVEGIFYE